MSVIRSSGIIVFSKVRPSLGATASSMTAPCLGKGFVDPLFDGGDVDGRVPEVQIRHGGDGSGGRPLRN